MLLNPSSRPTLGKVLAVYRGAPFSNRQVLTWYLPGMLTVLLIFGYGLSRAFQAKNYGPVAVATWGRPAFILAAVLLVPLLFFMTRHIHARRKAVFLHQNGLSFKNIRTRHSQLLWTELSGIAVCNEKFVILHFPVSIRYRVTLIPTTGKPIWLDERLENLPDLAARIKARLYPRLKAEYHHQFGQGHWLFFGPLHISKNRVRIQRNAFKQLELDWSQVKRVRVRAGRLIFEPRSGKESSIPTALIPNLELLLSLLEEEITK